MTRRREKGTYTVRLHIFFQENPEGGTQNQKTGSSVSYGISFEKIPGFEPPEKGRVGV